MDIKNNALKFVGPSFEDIEQHELMLTGGGGLIKDAVKTISTLTAFSPKGVSLAASVIASIIVYDLLRP